MRTMGLNHTTYLNYSKLNNFKSSSEPTEAYTLELVKKKKNMPLEIKKIIFSF